MDGVRDVWWRAAVAGVVWWLRVRTWLRVRSYNMQRRRILIPGLRVEGVARELLWHPVIREWMFLPGCSRRDRLRRLAAWKVLESPALTAEDWDDFVCMVRWQEFPPWLLGDERAPTWLVAAFLNTGRWGDGDMLELATRRAEVRDRLSDYTRREWLLHSPVQVALRALDGLSVVTRDDMAQVLRRRDSATVLAGYLMTHWRDVPEEQWELLLMDWRSSWGVVRDARTPEGVLRRYVASTYPTVLEGIAAQERLPEGVRVMAALGAQTPVA